MYQSADYSALRKKKLSVQPQIRQVTIKHKPSTNSLFSTSITHSARYDEITGSFFPSEGKGYAKRFL
jgi:hypothetical protein